MLNETSKGTVVRKRDWSMCQIGRPDELLGELTTEIRDRFEPFSVYGSGLLFVGRTTGHSCGKATNGVSLAVSFSPYGVTSGVLDYNEAKRLADHIYSVLGLGEHQ